MRVPQVLRPLYWWLALPCMLTICVTTDYIFVSTKTLSGEYAEGDELACTRRAEREPPAPQCRVSRACMRHRRNTVTGARAAPLACTCATAATPRMRAPPTHGGVLASDLASVRGSLS